MRLALLLCSLLAVVSANAQLPSLWQPPYFNGIAAQVGESIITYDDVRRELIQFAPGIEKSAADQDDFDRKMRVAADGVLQGMVERRLLIEEFKRKGYKIPDYQIDNRYRNVLENSFDGKLSEMVKALHSQGKNIDSLRNDIRDNMMADAMRGRFRSTLPKVTPEQIQEHYNLHKSEYAQQASFQLQVITLKPIADEPEEVLVQSAEAIIERIEQGESFEAIAEELGQSDSIDWGWLKANELNNQLKDALTGLAKGDISKPIALASDQILIVRIAQRKDEAIPALADLSEIIEKKIREENTFEAYETWIAQLKEKIYVKLSD